MNFFKSKLFHSLFSTGNKSELINPETNKTIFIFGGRVPTYERIGKQLYTYYPDFKSKLNECDEVIKKISGTSILPFILGEKSKNEISIEFDKCYTQAIQISLIHLLNSEGIEIKIGRAHV
jgi:acyl transferase domain-containing protein